MPVAVRVCLEEDGARSIFGGVCGDGEWLREVGEVEDRSRQEEFLQVVKRLLTSGGPIPAVVFLGEV